MASFYVTLADNQTSHQVSAGNTIHPRCAVPSCQVLSLLLGSHSERNEFELPDAVVVSSKKAGAGTPSDCVSVNVLKPSRFSAIPLLSSFPLTPFK